MRRGVASRSAVQFADNLKQEAARANRGTLEAFIKQSIVDPAAYLEPGYHDLMSHVFRQQIPLCRFHLFGPY